MERVFKDNKSKYVGLLKLLATNLLITPILNGVYLAALASFAGANFNGVLRIVKTKLLGLLKISWVVFPAVQVFAFKNLPPPTWVPFFNLVAFVFGTIINIRAKLEAKKKEIKDVDEKEQ